MPIGRGHDPVERTRGWHVSRMDRRDRSPIRLLGRVGHSYDAARRPGALALRPASRRLSLLFSSLMRSASG